MPQHDIERAPIERQHGVEAGLALATGRLVAPFPIVATKKEAWYLEYRPGRANDPALIAFRGWLQGEAKRQRQIEAELVKRPINSQARKIGAAAVG